MNKCPKCGVEKTVYAKPITREEFIDMGLSPKATGLTMLIRCTKCDAKEIKKYKMKVLP